MVVLLNSHIQSDCKLLSKVSRSIVVGMGIHLKCRRGTNYTSPQIELSTLMHSISDAVKNHRNNQ